MEPIIDRIIAILQAELPAALTKINTFMATSDTTLYTVPLTLKEPLRYLYDDFSHVADVPCLVVEAVDTGAEQPSTEEQPQTLKAKYNIVVFFHADEGQIAQRMLSRYGLALNYVMRGYSTLQHPTGNNDELAMSGTSSPSAPKKVAVNDSVYNMVKVVLEYTTAALTIEHKIGLK